MPDTEPMTGSEIARAVKRIDEGIINILNKMDTKTDKLDQRIIDEKQDAAIEKVESKIDKLIWSLTATALSSVGALVLAVFNRSTLG